MEIKHQSQWEAQKKKKRAAVEKEVKTQIDFVNFWAHRELKLEA